MLVSFGKPSDGELTPIRASRQALGEMKELRSNRDPATALNAFCPQFIDNKLKVSKI
jgi:hypothetical protein